MPELTELSSIINYDRLDTNLTLYYVHGSFTPVPQSPEAPHLTQAMTFWANVYGIEVTEEQVQSVAGMSVSDALDLLISQLEESPDNYENIIQTIQKLKKLLDEDVGDETLPLNSLQEKYNAENKIQRDAFATLIALIALKNKPYSLEQMVQVVGALVRNALGSSFQQLNSERKKLLESGGDLTALVDGSDSLIVAHGRRTELERLREQLYRQVKEQQGDSVLNQGTSGSISDEDLAAMNLSFKFNPKVWASQVERQNRTSEAINALLEQKNLTQENLMICLAVGSLMNAITVFAQGNVGLAARNLNNDIIPLLASLGHPIALFDAGSQADASAAESSSGQPLDQQTFYDVTSIFYQLAGNRMELAMLLSELANNLNFLTESSEISDENKAFIRRLIELMTIV